MTRVRQNVSMDGTTLARIADVAAVRGVTVNAQIEAMLLLLLNKADITEFQTEERLAQEYQRGYADYRRDLQSYLNGLGLPTAPPTPHGHVPTPHRQLVVALKRWLDGTRPL